MSVNIKLPLGASELFAIYKALKYFQNNFQNRKCVIVTDSLSSIMLFLSREPQIYRYLVYDIREILPTNMPNIIIKWVPGHRGIKENIMAKSIPQPGPNVMMLFFNRRLS